MLKMFSLRSSSVSKNQDCEAPLRKYETHGNTINENAFWDFQLCFKTIFIKNARFHSAKMKPMGINFGMRVVSVDL